MALFAALALAGMIGILAFNVGQTTEAQEMPLQPPTNLTAVTTSQTNIVLVWTPAAMGNGYRVERSEDGRTGWVMLDPPDTPLTMGSTTYSDTDESLDLSTTYYYRVSAVDATRRSRPSNVANATTGGVQPPGAPSVPTLAVEGPSRIMLTWTMDANTPTGGGDITGYRIEYSDDSNDPPTGTWRVLVANTMSSTDLTHTDYGSVAALEAGDQRWYRVSAINSAGVGTTSPPMRSEPTPGTAAVLTEAPTGLTARAMGPTQIELSWTAPKNVGDDEITGYQIEFGDLTTTTGDWVDLDDLVPNTGNDKTTYTDDGSEQALSAETTRRYRVYAINAATGDRAGSNVASATTGEATVPGKPTALRLVPTGPEAITVNWTAPVNTGGDMITGYRIERSENGTAWTVVVASFTPQNIANTPEMHPDRSVPKANTRWHYRVSAINSEGRGAPSDSVSAPTHQASVPGAPTGLTAWEGGRTRIVLQWQEPEATGGEITGYKIEYSAAANGPWTDLVADTMSDATTYTDDAELEAGDIRYYRVSTINSFETSAISNVYSAVAGDTELNAPTGLRVVNSGQKHFTLTWTAAAGTGGTGYMVERSEDNHTGWAMVGAVVSGITTTTTIDMDESLKLSTRYYYRVSMVADTTKRSRPSSVANQMTGGVESPGAPSITAVTPLGPSRIMLTWTMDANTPTGGGEITGYRIEYSDDSNDPPTGTWRVLVANTMSSTDLTHTDYGSVAALEAGDQRWYRVSAINSAGAGTASPPMRNSVATQATAQVATGAPTGLTARAMGPTQIELSWTAPKNVGDDEITGYQIQFGDLITTTGDWVDLDDLVPNTGNDKTTYTDDGSEQALSAETTRRYRVYAINAANTDNTSDGSNVASATTGEATVPGKPTALRLTPTTSQAITLNWTAPINTGGDMITGYRIERSENGTAWTVVVASFTPQNIANTPEMHPDRSVPKANTGWHYRVSAINSEGTGDASDSAFAYTYVASAPGMPTDLTAWEEGPTRIVLLWQEPDTTGGEISGYKIEYSADGSTSWMELVANTMSDATTYVDDGSVAELEAGDIRYYRVSTINSFETSAISNVYSALTGAMALGLTVDGPATASHAENDTDMVATYTVSGPGSDMATWTLEGADRGDFRISNGMLTFATPPNFEMPASADMDNEYMVTVKATSGTNTDMRDVTVTVTNVNEPGTVTLSTMRPIVGTEVTAELTDPDGMVSDVTWDWWRSATADGELLEIVGEIDPTYIPTAADENMYIKARALYTDPEASGQVAPSDAALVTAGDPLVIRYDANGNGMVDRGEVIAAITDYLNEVGGITRANVIYLIGLYLAGP